MARHGMALSVVHTMTAKSCPLTTSVVGSIYILSSVAEQKWVGRRSLIVEAAVMTVRQSFRLSVHLFANKNFQRKLIQYLSITSKQPEEKETKTHNPRQLKTRQSLDDEVTPQKIDMKAMNLPSNIDDGRLLRSILGFFSLATNKLLTAASNRQPPTSSAERWRIESTVACKNYRHC